MENSYQQIIHQLPKKQKIQHFDSIFKELDVESGTKYLDKNFLKAYQKLQQSYPAIFKLIGQDNGKIIAYQYFRYFPISDKNNQYGKAFADFIHSHPAMIHLKYLKWIAKLDWFWTHKDQQYILLPKGTFHSWGNIFSDTNELDVNIDEHFMERLVIKKTAQDYKIEID